METENIVLLSLLGLIVLLVLYILIRRAIEKAICKKRGHKFIDKDIKVRTNDGWSAATDKKAIQQYCKRCGYFGEVTVGETITSYTSCSMPNRMWDEIREKGYTII